MKLKISGPISMDKRAYLTKRITFQAMHKLESEGLSFEENTRIFGKCVRTHGHNYALAVTVRGSVDDKSGLCCNRDELDLILQNEIVTRYHGTHLNDAFENTTGEILVRSFFSLLKDKLQGFDLFCVLLEETPQNHFYYGTEEFFKTPRNLI